MMPIMKELPSDATCHGLEDFSRLLIGWELRFWYSGELDLGIMGSLPTWAVMQVPVCHSWV